MSRSIVMVDWSRRNEPTTQTRDEFLWHQTLLSLLYDEVFAQDEILVCSQRMARWFGDEESFRLLEELVECGGLSVLKRPWERYPKELQEQALKQPIAARKVHLERFSVNNDGAPLQFNLEQLQFHKKLEGLLASRDHAHRFAGSKKKQGKDLMQQFASLLAKVLTERKYKRWLRLRFKNITPEIADDFVQYIRDPDSAIDRLKAQMPDRPPKFTPQSGAPVFSTALAVQVAAIYGEREAKELQDLIETVFARPFCEEEDAEGRYGSLLRELPFLLKDEGRENAGPVDAVKVIEAVKIPVGLPSPGPNFANIIGKLRQLDSMKQLRKAMNQLGRDTKFANATDAWNAVAADLAGLVSKNNLKEINMWVVLVEAGKAAFCGAMADFLIRPPSDVHDLAFRLPERLGKALFEVGGGLGIKLGQVDLERQRLTELLEQAVEFSCVPHPTIKADQEQQ